jgi:DNA-binding phage protein
MPKLELTDEELAEWHAYRGLTQASPDKVLAGLIGQIRQELLLSGMGDIQLAKRIGMQPHHLRTILSIDEPSDPKFTTVVKIMSGLNMQLITGEIK